MTVVAIQPSYGTPAARRHWRITLDQEVPFAESPHVSSLTAGQLDSLMAVHPTGRARFWGATKVQDRNMDRLRPGDVVLFTGGKLVRGIGEVGVTLRNAAFADTMWSQDPDNGSWRNVYSLAAFQPTEIPYEEIWALPSFNANDNFMGLRLLEGAKAEEILQGLGIETPSQRRQLSGMESAVATALAEGALIDPAETRVIAVECLHTPVTTYERNAGPVLVNRAEALLVTEYVSSLHTPGLDVQRLRTPAGITDLHLTGPEGTEIVEAKRGFTHRFVREALGQLLDYAPHSPQPTDRLSGLFPSRPIDHDIALLHRYGIDCVFRTTAGHFERSAAPADVRDHMRKAWHSA
ncbi:hypothetical protein [Kitasatospora sp. NPDC057198]|uniref:hypothetical protein n=1 Tax=Kitasatospora sp. NPDC057198 TaxID=3346046 RepID=UPI00362A4366